MNEVRRMPQPDCERALALFAQQLDGEIPLGDSGWLQAHTAKCPACAAAMADFAALDHELIACGMQADAAHPAPEGMRERLAARMISRPRPNRLWWLPASAALAAALIVFAVSARKPATPANRDDAQFVEIPYLPPLDPHENTTVVRMDVDVRTLIAAGYRVNADPNSMISADVLVGEDGRAHAIRLAPLKN